jgi:hypothetical protein
MQNKFDGLVPGDVIYVAGPMRGIRYFNFPAFDAARDALKSLGFGVVSPADLDRGSGFDPFVIEDADNYDWRDLKKIGFSLADALDRDVEAIKRCDAIYLLDGWQQSKGACAEKAIAEWLGLVVVYQSEQFESQHNASPRDGETEVNAAGGKQSFIAARFDCIPAICQRLLAQCLGFGARKYGKENWHKIPIEDNLAHAMNHLNEWRLGDRSEPHLVNTLARVNFALWQAVQSGEQAEHYVHPDMAAK